MGFWKSLNYSNNEKNMLNQYSQLLMTITGLSYSEARKKAKDILDEAITQSKNDGTYNLPVNLGDIVLEISTTSDPNVQLLVKNIRNGLPNKRMDGVRDEDIRDYWNLNIIERHLMYQLDTLSRTAMYIDEINKNRIDSKEMASEKALLIVYKYHPLYGDPDDTSFTSGEDRPLPIELKNRINIYIQKRFQRDQDDYKKEIEQSSSFNALLRKAIRLGEI